MSDVHSRTSLILAERNRWGYRIGVVAGYGLFDSSPSIATEMVKVIDAVNVANERYEESLLSAFLDNSSALRAVLERAMDKAADAVASRIESDQDSRDMKTMIRSSEDLQIRERDLLHATGQIRRRAQDLLRGKISRVLDSVRSIINRRQADEQREGPDAILGDITEQIACARASFQTRSSVDIEERIARIEDVKRKKDEFRVAEESAQFIEGVLRGIGSQHLTDEAQRSATAQMPENVADSIRLWLAGAKPVYFLCGEPGTGKSQMASELCESLRSGKVPTVKLGASFFFPRNDERLASYRFALSSLFSQLSPQHTSDQFAVMRDHLYRGDPAEQLLRTVLAATPSHAQVQTVLVIDAIDQCRETAEVPRVLRSLLELVREFPWLYIFFAARPRPNVMAVLSHPSFADLIHRQQLDNSLNLWNNDARQYLESVVPGLHGYSEYLRKHPDALQALIRRTGGDFAFARMAVRYLDTDASQPEVLMTSLLEDKDDAMSLPSTLYLRFQPLHSAYSATYKRTFERNTYIRTVLRFVAYTRHGLTPDLISSYAHDISADDVIFAVDHLRVALTIDQDATIISHDASFHKFLIEFQLSKDGRGRYQMDMDTHFASISIASLYLATPLTAVLQSRLPPTLLPSGDERYLSSPLLACWPLYLSNSMPQHQYQNDFSNQFTHFSPSVQLAMYAWVTESSDLYRTARIVARFFARVRATQCWESHRHVDRLIIFERWHSAGLQVPHSTSLPPYSTHLSPTFSFGEIVEISISQLTMFWMRSSIVIKIWLFLAGPSIATLPGLSTAYIMGSYLIVCTSPSTPMTWADIVT
ncbi:AAA-16 domain-containing protein [Phanerochaete sordida]|uniref:AAA-16 domain-containing protein n=1 Tax=Phanerochaete sordida TaxID=48140 RepID=A0A9P3GKE0_9APHY|nr:AAA-16 domain-containing protein [Phanerochaete sordida]